ncbi:3-oxoacyl-(acyl-carrier-protein) synthase [Vibrio ishigakensis]|uniref:3-oxoacyl-[acyl-carrier-protein] synthase 1 n=1 Tax=Vibrio ishigakensis TaxID=1481914 RepID=A0A0B8P5N6_9VIBR|nr:3-oxoacyl-(acyl-carrier-protein) synthase [Vibrio ishigakensis]
MKRVVITGMGIVSSIGNNVEEVLESLKAGKSGIEASEQFKENGLRSQVWGSLKINPAEHIDRKQMRFMGDAAAYAYLSMEQAIADSGLTPEQVSNERAGIVAGSGGASSLNQVAAIDTLREKNVKRVGPYMVTRTMAQPFLHVLQHRLRSKVLTTQSALHVLLQRTVLAMQWSLSNLVSKTLYSLVAVKNWTTACL